MKKEYDSRGNLIYIESSNGVWHKYEYDQNHNVIYKENSYGNWYKNIYNSNNKCILVIENGTIKLHQNFRRVTSFRHL